MQSKNFTPLFLAGLAVLIGLAFLPIPVSGQVENHLILKKNGYVNKLHFLTGDPITFIREGNKYPEESYLEGIGIDFIVVSGQVIPINQISYLIRYRTGFNFVVSGKALMVAAPGYLVIGAINALLHGDSPKPSVTNLVVAGVLLTAGVIFPKFQVRKYPIGKKFTLKIVQSDPALNR
jgi:hypothetical protein